MIITLLSPVRQKLEAPPSSIKRVYTEGPVRPSVGQYHACSCSGAFVDVTSTGCKWDLHRRPLKWPLYYFRKVIKTYYLRAHPTYGVPDQAFYMF